MIDRLITCLHVYGTAGVTDIANFLPICSPASLIYRLAVLSGLLEEPIGSYDTNSTIKAKMLYTSCVNISRYTSLLLTC